MKYAFNSKVRDGRLILDTPDKLHEVIKSFEGKRTTISISLFRKPRTGKENRYYHGVVVKMLAKFIGYDKDEMHEVLKYMFLLDKTGKYPRVKSTASLSTVEFETYLSQIRMWASKSHKEGGLEFYIPMPNEIEY